MLSWLQGYRWPGNVRELENAIERAVILTTGSTISRDAVTFEATVGANLQAASIPSLKLQQNVEWMERETIRLALAMSTAKDQAAKLMGISPRALSYYLAKYAFGDPNADYGGVLIPSSWAGGTCERRFYRSRPERR